MTRRVLILGLGVEGKAALRFGRAQGWTLTAADRQDPGEDLATAHPDVTWTDEDGAAGIVTGVDLLLRSPGVPPTHPVITAAELARLPVTTPTGYWLGALCPSSTLTVTGTKGKSTTVALTVSLLTALGADSEAYGNIGLPPLDERPATAGTPVVELSSYMLHDARHGSYRHHVTNLYKDHVPWHGSVDAYRAAKLRPFRFSPPCPGFAPRTVIGDEVLPASTEAVEDVVSMTDEGTLIIGDEPLMPATLNARFAGEAPLLCLRMALAALTHRFAAKALCDAARETLPHFKGLPGRLETIPSTDQRRWICDPLATIPEAAASALASVPPGPVTLLLGGLDRGQDMAPLAKVIIAHSEVTPVVFGSTRAKMAAALSGANVSVYEEDSFRDALVRADRITDRGGTILFSPAAATEPPEADYRERATLFAQAASSALR